MRLRYEHTGNPRLLARDRHRYSWSSTAVVAYGQPGGFLRETGADDALSFVSIGAQYRF